jgi:hypothetical protein
VLNPEQKAQYETMRQLALDDLEAIDREMASELGRVKKRLLELQEDKKAVKQILDGASARLGLPPSPPLKDVKLADLSRLSEPVTDVASPLPRIVAPSAVGSR